MKKMFAILMVLSMLFSLCACGGNTENSPETTTPVTEAVVPTTEPIPETTEALSECDVNGHDWVEANYQNPKTCSVCGEIDGEALKATFEEYNLPINVTELGTEYAYVTTCSADTTQKTVGKLTVSDYRVFEGDETHPALEGYEWHAITLNILFDDENAGKYGMGVKPCYENYYDTVGVDASCVYDEATKFVYFTVNYNGVEYIECIIDDSQVITYSEWVDNTCTCTFDCYVRVPIGYDGVVIGLYDWGIVRGEGQYIFDIADENSLFFRMDGNNAK